KDGVVTQAPNIPSWDGQPIRSLLQKSLDIPCFIENDANAIAVGEMWMGAGKGFSHICCLTLGTGVGGGVIIDGELLRGADGMAAELGHIAVKSDGIPCNCGSFGCLETFVSATGMQRMVNLLRKNRPASSLPDAINGAVLYEHARAGDALAVEVLTTAGKGLG